MQTRLWFDNSDSPTPPQRAPVQNSLIASPPLRVSR
jgi:hypothetical protein